jgi:hypothetical protein
MHSFLKTTVVACLLGGAALAASATTVTFDNGTEGWTGPKGSGGFTWVDKRFGNDAPALHTWFSDFGITFSNTTNSAFVGDLTVNPSITIGIDTLTRSINSFGQVPRDFIVELRDHSNPQGGLPYTSVWYDLGVLTSANTDWKHFEVTIADTSATALPTGWGGYGAEDPSTGAPILPADRTFASVLAHVDELVFTTLEPGWFYADAKFNVVVDNISIAAVPEPATLGMMALGLAAVGGIARRRRG